MKILRYNKRKKLLNNTIKVNKCSIFLTEIFFLIREKRRRATTLKTSRNLPRSCFRIGSTLLCSQRRKTSFSEWSSLWLCQKFLLFFHQKLFYSIGAILLVEPSSTFPGISNYIISIYYYLVPKYLPSRFFISFKQFFLIL